MNDQSNIMILRNGTWENRCKNLEELIQLNYGKYPKNQIEHEKYLSFIFENTIDLLLDKSSSIPNECRHRIWRSYCKLLNGQAETIGMLRYYLFNTILNLDNNDDNDDDYDDIPDIIDFLVVLTDYGKILLNYESKIAYFIINLIDCLFESTTNVGGGGDGQLKLNKYETLMQQKFLKFMINLIKYNATYVASDNSKALIKMIRYVCSLAYQSKSIMELELIYEFLNVVLSYSHLPTETLSQFIVILCIGLNRDELYIICQKIMRNLIGTYLGYDALTTLHHIIEDEINFKDKLLIRGAVYFLVQSLWGNMMINQNDKQKTTISANVILPSFKILLNNDMASSPLIALEIANGIQMFIIDSINQKSSSSSSTILENNQRSSNESINSLKSSNIIYQYTWDLVLDVCDMLVNNYLLLIQNDTTIQLKSTILSILKLLERLVFFNIITIDEHYFDDDDDNVEDIVVDDNNGDDNMEYSLRFLSNNEYYIEKIFTIFEMASDHLTNETIYNLIEHRLKHINHIDKYRFDLEYKLKQLKHVINIYFISPKNNSIRLKCLEKLENFLNVSTFLDADVFWENVASNFFSISNDDNNRQSLRELAINFLIFLARKLQSNKNLMEFIEIFEHTIHNRFRLYRQHSIETVSLNHRSQNNIGPIITHQLSAPNNVNEINNIFDDAIRSVDGLIIIFIENINHIQCHMAAIQSFRSLIKILAFVQKLHYLHSFSGEMDSLSSTSSLYNRTLSLIKRKIFHTILSLRTNRWAQLGVVVDNISTTTTTTTNHHHYHNHDTSNQDLESIRFSPYILIREIMIVSNQQSSPPISPQRQQTSTVVNETNSNSPIINTSSPLSSSSTTTTTTSSTTLLFHGAFIDALKLIIETIQCEKDWSVLHLIFIELPKTLKHKGLILAANASTNSSNHSTPSSSMTHLSIKTESIPDLMVNALCTFIDFVLNRFNELHLGEAKMSKVDILVHIYNSISALVGYKLLSTSQNSIVKYLLNGLIHFSSKMSCLRQCIVSLTICSIEMQTTMNRYLSDTIMQLSKITTTKALAIPKLEFLSNIIVFPDIYYTFTNKQYLSIFMIAQSYINPCKYGEYTVALALRVISMWFLKCPIPCRMDLVHLLMKGFQYNILKDNESNQLALLMAQKLTTDSTKSNLSGNQTNDHHTQQQSFNFSSSSAFNMVGHGQQLGNDSVIFDPNDKEKSKFELVEVCMDMLASNAFTTSSPLPLKPSMIDKLLNKDKTQYWMIGHKIIQITTTGCTSRAMRNGLCNKCHLICHMNRSPKSTTINNSLNNLMNNWNEKFNNVNNDLNQSIIANNFDQSLTTQQQQQDIAIRRRHRSEINHSTTTKSSNYNNDDYFINQQQQQQQNMIQGSSSSIESDSNVVSRYCRCWCQTWAEILIRRSTGTTRFILRVENNLGEFPNWISSKHEDDSLAQIFENSFPDLNIVSNSNNDNNEISKQDSNQNDDDDDAKSNSGTISSLNDQQKQPQEKAKISQPVSRAASFGGSRTLQTHNITKFFDVPQTRNNNDMETGKYRNHHHVRKLEKDFSFEENTPNGSQTSLVSSSGSGDNESSKNFQPSTMFRDRGHTISVMTPVQKSSSSSSAFGSGVGHHESSMSASNINLSSRQPFSPAGLSPQFVFLQLYYNSMFKDKICLPNSNVDFEKPIQLERNDALKISLSIFDRITPYETHKIGILYIGPGQTNNRADILANRIGSFRYAKFLKNIGQLISLEDIDPRVFYVGGLGVKDGPYAISWCDHLVQMIFHVATMMPTLDNDPKCNNKMAHIGNDLVCIVYNNSGENFDLFSLKSGFGQVMLAVVLITPLEYDSNIVEIKSRKEFAEFIGYTESQVLSDDALPVYVRQLAIHANLGAMVYHPKQEMRSYHISNWLSRLRNIKRVRKRAQEHYQQQQQQNQQQQQQQQQQHGQMDNHERYSNRSNTIGTRMVRQNQQSTSIGDESISSATTTTTNSAISPNIYNSGGGIGNSFDYETLSSQRLVFPDFTEFTKDF
ncbi:TSC complex subunit tuberin isoform X3 [Dermatophagoides pteronyssinus]|uniref:TSC complex subunit tuberin isoform X3 n=1 Tax=Dermatophagoides pteronyssinus TaxID=6956 RepID=UPI003F673F1C